MSSPPSGRSTLTTVAPRSARVIANGPATTRVKSPRELHQEASLDEYPRRALWMPRQPKFTLRRAIRTPIAESSGSPFLEVCRQAAPKPRHYELGACQQETMRRAGIVH